MQTFFDVVHKGGKLNGAKCNAHPLRRHEAETLMERVLTEYTGGGEIAVVPTSDLLWEETYGDKESRP